MAIALDRFHTLPAAISSRYQCWKFRTLPMNAARLCLVSELSYVYVATFPAAKMMAPRTIPPVVQKYPPPNGICDRFDPWKKQPKLTGTGAEVSSRSPAVTLAEPDAVRSAGRPVPFGRAMQYFSPSPGGARAIASTWGQAVTCPARTVTKSPSRGATNVEAHRCQFDICGETACTCTPKLEASSDTPTSTAPRPPVRTDRPS